MFPPIQGAIADAANTRISFVVPLVGYVVVLVYAAHHWARHGFKVLRIKQTDVPAAYGSTTLGGTVIEKRGHRGSVEMNEVSAVSALKE